MTTLQFNCGCGYVLKTAAETASSRAVLATDVVEAAELHTATLQSNGKRHTGHLQGEVSP